jgi:hypothetical protein
LFVVPRHYSAISFTARSILKARLRCSRRPVMHLSRTSLGIQLCSLRIGLVAMSVAACSSFHRVPKTAPVPAARDSTPPPPPPLFTSHDGAPISFVPSTSDAKTTRIVIVREGLTKQTLFRIATDYLAQKNTIYVSDPNAGFLMTPWQASLSRDGVPELRYRTRIILRFLGDDWKQLAVNAEANWLRGEEWQYGYDSALLDSVSTNLTARLGKRA